MDFKEKKGADPGEADIAGIKSNMTTGYDLSVEKIEGSEEMITSIELTNATQMMSLGTEIGEHVLTLNRTGKIIHSLYTGRKDKPAESYTYDADPKSMESFFRLFTDIQAEWNDDYDVLVMDGWRWECLIRHEDGIVRKVTGTVEPPPYGKLLRSSIENLAKFKVRPWIFPGR